MRSCTVEIVCRVLVLVWEFHADFDRNAHIQWPAIAFLPAKSAACQSTNLQKVHAMNSYFRMKNRSKKNWCLNSDGLWNVTDIDEYWADKLGVCACVSVFC